MIKQSSQVTITLKKIDKVSETVKKIRKKKKDMVDIVRMVMEEQRMRGEVKQKVGDMGIDDEEEEDKTPLETEDKK